MKNTQIKALRHILSKCFELKKSAHRKSVPVSESRGRSMVEMLGVLSLSGLIVLAGLAGFQYALEVHRENETLNRFSKVVAGARTGRLLENYGPDTVECTPAEHDRGECKKGTPRSPKPWVIGMDLVISNIGKDYENFCYDQETKLIKKGCKPTVNGTEVARSKIFGPLKGPYKNGREQRVEIYVQVENPHTFTVRAKNLTRQACGRILHTQPLGYDVAYEGGVDEYNTANWLSPDELLNGNKADELCDKIIGEEPAEDQEQKHGELVLRFGEGKSASPQPPVVNCPVDRPVLCATGQCCADAGQCSDDGTCDGRPACAPGLTVCNKNCCDVNEVCDGDKCVLNTPVCPEETFICGTGCCIIGSESCIGDRCISFDDESVCTADTACYISPDGTPHCCENGSFCSDGFCVYQALKTDMGYRCPDDPALGVFLLVQGGLTLCGEECCQEYETCYNGHCVVGLPEGGGEPCDEDKKCWRTVGKEGRRYRCCAEHQTCHGDGSCSDPENPTPDNFWCHFPEGKCHSRGRGDNYECERCCKEAGYKWMNNGCCRDDPNAPESKACCTGIWVESKKLCCWENDPQPQSEECCRILGREWAEGVPSSGGTDNGVCCEKGQYAMSDTDGTMYCCDPKNPDRKSCCLKAGREWAQTDPSNEEIGMCCPFGQSVMTDPSTGARMCCDTNNPTNEGCCLLAGREWADGQETSGGSGSAGMCCPQGQHVVTEKDGTQSCCDTNNPQNEACCLDAGREFARQGEVINPDGNVPLGICCPAGQIAVKLDSDDGLVYEDCCNKSNPSFKECCIAAGREWAEGQETSGGSGGMCCPTGQPVVTNDDGTQSCCDTQNPTDEECCLFAGREWAKGQETSGGGGSAGICCPRGQTVTDNGDGTQSCCDTQNPGNKSCCTKASRLWAEGAETSGRTESGMCCPAGQTPAGEVPQVCCEKGNPANRDCCAAEGRLWAGCGEFDIGECCKAGQILGTGEGGCAYCCTPGNPHIQPCCLAEKRQWAKKTGGGGECCAQNQEAIPDDANFENECCCDAGMACSNNECIPVTTTFTEISTPEEISSTTLPGVEEGEETPGTTGTMTEATSSFTEATSSVTELISSVTEITSAVTEATSSVTELTSAVTEASSSVTELTSPYTELTSAQTMPYTDDEPQTMPITHQQEVTTVPIITTPATTTAERTTATDRSTWSRGNETTRETTSTTAPATTGITATTARTTGTIVSSVDNKDETTEVERWPEATRIKVGFGGSAFFR